MSVNTGLISANLNRHQADTRVVLPARNTPGDGENVPARVEAQRARKTRDAAKSSFVFSQALYDQRHCRRENAAPETEGEGI
jgi:hypothetical protein